MKQFESVALILGGLGVILALAFVVHYLGTLIPKPGPRCTQNEDLRICTQGDRTWIEHLK